MALGDLVRSLGRVFGKRVEVVERRGAARLDKNAATRLFVVFEDRKLGADAQMLDVSETGLRLSCRAALAVGVTVACEIPSETAPARNEWFKIVWRTRNPQGGHSYGLQGLDESHDALRAYLAAA